MKKAIILLTLLFFSAKYVVAQSELSPDIKLASIAQIWGFLKYYHPEVAGGKIDWDKELFKLLLKVETAKDKHELSLIFIDLIDGLGTIKACKRCDKLADEKFFLKNFDLSWTQNQNIFTDELSAKLKFIETNRYQGRQYYFNFDREVYGAIPNEKNYENMEFPTKNFRLLGLFRYWNVIEYFYPYKHLTDEKWDDVLVEMIPKFVDATDKNQYRIAIKELITKINDSHAWISLEDKSQFKTLPIKLKYIDDKVIISGFLNDSIADIENLKFGDIILEADDIPIDSLIQMESRYIAASNDASKMNLALLDITSGTENSRTLKIERKGNVMELNPSQYNFSEFHYSDIKDKVIYKKLQETIGYLNMIYLKEDMLEDMMSDFKHTKGIVIDLRGYPQMSYIELSRYFPPKEQMFCIRYEPNLKYPGTFTLREGKIFKTHETTYNGKIVVMVDENSLSRSEFAAMSFQNASNAITIGSQTAGADGGVKIIDYLGGYKTAYTGNGWLYPDGTETQRKGVKIDIVVKPTIKGLQEGRDEVLEKAIEIINQN